MGTLSWKISPFSTPVESNGETVQLGVQELRDLARGFCGALFVSLPLLYTEEMWARALLLPDWAMLSWVVLGYFACLGYIRFAGFRAGSGGHSAWMDAVSALGIGALASLVTLLLIGRWGLSDAPDVIIRIVMLEMVPTAIGASVAINQLGGGGSSDADEMKKLHPDMRVILATALGALLFAFNIAPTIETQKIVYSIGWWHLLSIALFSLAVSYLTVFVARFSTREREGTGVTSSRWVETAVAYLVALLVSYLLLTMFGYITGAVPFKLQLAWIVVLGYGTSLGGAAGRLIL